MRSSFSGFAFNHATANHVIAISSDFDGVHPLMPQEEQAASAAAATAGGHDVRDEIFEIARPVGWSTEAQDPPGAGMHCVQDAAHLMQGIGLCSVGRM